MIPVDLLDLELRLAALEKRITDLENRPVNSVQQIILDKELDRILEQMKEIKRSYTEHQSWSRPDTDNWNKLVHKKKEIRKRLGLD